MALRKSSVIYNVAPSYDATFPTSQFVKFLPKGTVSNVIVKWKRQGATTAQPRSGRQHKLTERDRRVLKRVMRQTNCPPLQHSLPSSKLPLESTSEYMRACGFNPLNLISIYTVPPPTHSRVIYLYYFLHCSEDIRTMK